MIGGGYLVCDKELRHHGILGMKWGVRRFQNSDGSLTEKGKKRYVKVASSDRLQKRDTRIAKKYCQANHKKLQLIEILISKKAKKLNLKWIIKMQNYMLVMLRYGLNKLIFWIKNLMM